MTIVTCDHSKIQAKIGIGAVLKLHNISLFINNRVRYYNYYKRRAKMTNIYLRYGGLFIKPLVKIQKLPHICSKSDYFYSKICIRQNQPVLLICRIASHRHYRLQIFDFYTSLKNRFFIIKCLLLILFLYKGKKKIWKNHFQREFPAESIFTQN